MRVPHGKIEEALETHRKLRDQNPLFYAKMACWYAINGNVRDHKVAFVRGLFERSEEIYRDVAWMLLQDLPLYLVMQIILKKNPRSLRSSVINYLASMEEGELAYQLLRGAKDLRWMIRRLHIPTSNSEASNLQLIGKELFSKKPELRSIFKRLEEAKTEEEVKDLLRSTTPRVPAYIAVSALKVRTPGIMRVLIESMSANELLQSLNSLGRMGAIKPNMQLIRRKIEKAVADQRLNASRVNQIKKSLDAELVPPEIFDDLEFVTKEKIQRVSQIDKQVIILADASGSMERSLVAARQLAAMLAMACKQKPYIYTCSQTPMEIMPQQWNSSGVENAMSLITANGGTPLGAGLTIMRSQNRNVDAIVLITDGGENAPPFFLAEYAKLQNKPAIVVVRVPGEPDVLTRQMQMNSVSFDKIDLETVDQYSLDQIIRFIGKTSPFQMVVEIMSVPLPQRPLETKKPKYWNQSAEAK